MAFVKPVVEHWLEQEIAQWVLPMKDRSDDPSHHVMLFGAVTKYQHPDPFFRPGARSLGQAGSYLGWPGSLLSRYGTLLFMAI